MKVTHEAKMETLAFEDNEKYAKATPDIRIALGPLVYKKEGVTKLSFSHRAASEKQKVESALKAQLQEGDEVLCKQGISALTTQQLEAALHILRARWPQVQGSEGAALPHWVHAVISAQPEVIVTNLGDVHATLEDMAGVLKHKPTIQVTATLPDEVKDMLSMLYTDHVRMGKAASFIWGQTALGVFYDVNLSLAKADNALTQEIATRIVQHIMLGNFGGRILVDVPAQLNRNVFTKALQATLDRDILKTKLLGFTKSGLFEIVRPHYYVSTPHILTEGRLQKL